MILFLSKKAFYFRISRVFHIYRGKKLNIIKKKIINNGISNIILSTGLYNGK